jgi:hypothetical protein
MILERVSCAVDDCYVVNLSSLLVYQTSISGELNSIIDKIG